MKKITFFLLLFPFVLAACSKGGGETVKVDSVQSNFQFVYKIVTIEGCEYFRYQGAHGYLSLEHKGNCTNPIHCRRDTAQEKAAKTQGHEN